MNADNENTRTCVCVGGDRTVGCLVTRSLVDSRLKHLAPLPSLLLPQLLPQPPTTTDLRRCQWCTASARLLPLPTGTAATSRDRPPPSWPPTSCGSPVAAVFDYWRLQLMRTLCWVRRAEHRGRVAASLVNEHHRPRVLNRQGTFVCVLEMHQ